MKLTTTILLILFAGMGYGQKAIAIDSAKASWLPMSTYQSTYKMVFQGDWRTKYKPIDTVKCIMHLLDRNTPLEGWQKGYVVLIDGGVSTDNIEWKVPYLPMALGPFNNVFLGPDKKEKITTDYVIQIILIK